MPGGLHAKLCHVFLVSKVIIRIHRHNVNLPNTDTQTYTGPIVLPGSLNLMVCIRTQRQRGELKCRFRNCILRTAMSCRLRLDGRVTVT